MDPAYAYETRTKDGIAASTLAPTVAFVQTPGVDGVKPFMSTNRSTSSQKLMQKMFVDQMDSDVMRALEGTPRTIRGSRKKPSVMKYPAEIGSGEFPHVMQFKVFWRWERKDLAETLSNLKEETSKTLKGLNDLSGMISQNNLTKEMIEQSGLSNEQIGALKELANNTNLLKIVDPSLNDNLANMLTNNPNKAKLILEETIKSYQTRLSSIEAEISDGVGRVGLDEDERLLVFNRLNENIAQTGVGEAAVSGGLFGSILGGGLGLLLGGLKGGAIGMGLGAAAGGAGLAATVGAVKLFQNEAVYDQMLSIYLPFCGKINNEDSFQYEEPSQAVAGAFFDAAGNPIETAGQAVNVGIEKAAGAVGAAGAGALARGKVLNPRLEKLFKQKDFRSFSFSWEFYPRDKQEVEQVREIIEAFRYHSHPATEDATAENESKVQVVLRVPAEFEVRFLSTNPDPGAAGFVENEYIPRIGRCALNSISVDYTPNSIYSSFVDNSPTAIVLTMQFTEMGVLTREAVEKGF
jgi:hypothetical protein